MSRALQAALLSGLVFPGTGHLLLKKYARGWILIIVSTLALIFLFKGVLHQANDILQKIEASGGLLNLENLSTLAREEVASNPNPAPLGLAAWTLFVAWLVGIIDAYRLGKKFTAKSPP